MKHLIVLGSCLDREDDGETPNLDALAGMGELGMVGTAAAQTPSDGGICEAIQSVGGTDADVVTLTEDESDAERAISASLADGGGVVCFRAASDAEGCMASRERKIKMAEYIDGRVVGVIRELMRSADEPYRMLVLPVCASFASTKARVCGSVPYIIYDSTRERRAICRFSRREAGSSGNFVSDAATLIRRFMEN